MCLCHRYNYLCICIYYDLSIGNELKNNFQRPTAYKKLPVTIKLTWVCICKINIELY